MRVIITDFAKNQIRVTAKYIHKEFGSASKDKFMKNVRLTRKLIGINPYLGKKGTSIGEHTREPSKYCGEQFEQDGLSYG